MHLQVTTQNTSQIKQTKKIEFIGSNKSEAWAETNPVLKINDTPIKIGFKTDDLHIHTALFKIDNQQGPAVQHK